MGKTCSQGKGFCFFRYNFIERFYGLVNEWLIAKVNAYGFSLLALQLIHDYLPKTSKWTKTNSSDTTSSLLGPLLFNIFLINFCIYQVLHFCCIIKDLDTAWKTFVFRVILVRIFPHSDWIRKSADQNNSEYGHFLRSELTTRLNWLQIIWMRLLNS